MFHLTSSEFTRLNKQRVIRGIGPTWRKRECGQAKVQLSQTLLDGATNLEFRELFASHAAVMRTLVEKLNHRGGIVEADTSDNVGDVVAVQTARSRQQDVIRLPFL